MSAPRAFGSAQDLDRWWLSATPAGRDALVAKKVMGWPGRSWGGWRPSADLADAWAAGRAACARGPRAADRFVTALLTGDTRPDCFTDACGAVAWLFAVDDLPARICKAALLALAVTPEGDPTRCDPNPRP